VTTREKRKALTHASGPLLLGDTQGLARAPVGVGAGADADEAGGEDGEREDGGDEGCVHDVVLLWRAEGLPAAQLMLRGLFGLVSAGE
jgi:hypothetical protein